MEATRQRAMLGGAGTVLVFLAIALSQPSLASARDGADRKPAELWKTYPLDPTRDSRPTLGEAPSVSGTDESRPLERIDSPAPAASTTTSEATKSKAILFVVLAATLLVALAATALGMGARPARRSAAFSGDARRTRPADGYAALPVPPSKSGRSTPSSTSSIRQNPTEKGSSMVNFKRKPEGEEAAVESERDSPAGDTPRGESQSLAVPSDQASPAVLSFGEEVQTILDSAREAAIKIEKRAEEEASQIRAQAADSAEAERVEAERVRSDAEGYARETRAAADEAAEQRRKEAETEAGRILDEAQRRRDAIDAELAQKVEYAAVEAQKRAGTLEGEIQRQEKRLESIAVVLGSMKSQVTRVLERQEESDDLTDDLTNLTGRAVEGAESVRSET
jgi:hypothetical protein